MCTSEEMYHEMFKLIFKGYRDKYVNDFLDLSVEYICRYVYYITIFIFTCVKQQKKNCISNEYVSLTE